MKQTTINPTIANYHTIRSIIDGLEENSEMQNILRISYLFGLRVQEIIGKEPLLGSHFSEISIGGEEAILANVPTAKRAWKPMTVAIPLNPKYEEWSPIVLDFCERRYNNPISIWRSMRNVQKYCREIFGDLLYPTLSSRLKSGYYSDARSTNVTHKTLREIRGLELSFCNRFSSYDVLNFLRYLTPSDYSIYFHKMLDKTDIYLETDVNESVKIKNLIFQPRKERGLLDFRTYMDIQKRIKIGVFSVSTEKIRIDEKVDRPPSFARDSEDHRILKGTVKKKLLELGSKDVSYENANLDVVAEDLGIAVECGNSEGTKFIDFFKGEFRGISNYNEFWVATFYNAELLSTIYKFSRC
jgi:hypothetical protein